MTQLKFFKISLLTYRKGNFSDKRGNSMKVAALAQASAVCGLEPGDSEN